VQCGKRKPNWERREMDDRGDEMKKEKLNEAEVCESVGYLIGA